MRDAMEMTSRKRLERPAVKPAVRFDESGRRVAGGRGGESGAVDEEREGRGGDLGGWVRGRVDFRLRGHCWLREVGGFLNGC